jgi:hypothetical protein
VNLEEGVVRSEAVRAELAMSTEWCDGALRRHGRGNGSGVEVMARPRCAGRRGSPSEANGIAGLTSRGFIGELPPGQTSVALMARRWGSSQIEAWPGSTQGEMGLGS